MSDKIHDAMFWSRKAVDLIDRRGSWSGRAATAFSDAFRGRSALALQDADSLYSGYFAFEVLADWLSHAEMSGVDAQQHAADWGVVIDGDGNIVSPSSDVRLPIVVAAGFLFGSPWVVTISLNVWSAISKMKAANALAAKARNQFVTLLGGVKLS